METTRVRREIWIVSTKEEHSKLEPAHLLGDASILEFTNAIKKCFEDGASGGLAEAHK